ncbi:MAG: hypothetical protein ABI294_02125, partial [Casimicrobiaceae bacterium]
MVDMVLPVACVCERTLIVRPAMHATGRRACERPAWCRCRIIGAFLPPSAAIVSRLLVAMIVSVSLAGCGAWDTMSTSAKGSGAGLQAVLRYGGVLSGSGQGDIRFADRGDGVLMTLSV